MVISTKIRPPHVRHRYYFCTLDVLIKKKNAISKTGFDVFFMREK